MIYSYQTLQFYHAILNPSMEIISSQSSVSYIYLCLSAFWFEFDSGYVRRKNIPSRQISETLHITITSHNKYTTHLTHNKTLSYASLHNLNMVCIYYNELKPTKKLVDRAICVVHYIHAICRDPAANSAAPILTYFARMAKHLHHEYFNTRNEDNMKTHEEHMYVFLIFILDLILHEKRVYRNPLHITVYISPHILRPGSTAAPPHNRTVPHHRIMFIYNPTHFAPV